LLISLYLSLIHTCNLQESDDLAYGSDEDEMQKEKLKMKKGFSLKKGTGSRP